MTAQLVLWGHALAALLFGAGALKQARHQPASDAMPRRLLLAAMATTALWALAVAGIGPDDVTARVAEAARTIAWLGFTLTLMRRARIAEAPVVAVHLVAMVLAALVAGVAVAEHVVALAPMTAALRDTRLVLSMMTALGALVLVHHLYRSAAASARGPVGLAALALATMWAADLALFVAAYAGGGEAAALEAMRGGAMVAAALMVAMAVERGADWRLAVSRTATMRTLAVVAVALYAGVTAALTGMAGELAGGWARIVQTAIVVGATTALFTLASTPWLRAWTKVKVAKHLFSHRYDYRAEWQRFTDTLGRPGSAAASLAQRVVKAVADLTDSPAGLLLVPDGNGLGVGAGWRWQDGPGHEGDAADEATQPGGAALVGLLAGAGRIVELDPVRAGRTAQVEAAAIPAWMCARADAWVIVPLVHLDQFMGAILLARPPVDRALDWEDFDLLRIAGRQAASYLAEDRAHTALADAQRFDEFNRRFAFILHDLKNMVSQLTLVARNAERHADNPAFRADMVATLRDSSERMQALLARLSQRSVSPAETQRPVALDGLIDRVVASHRAGHPVRCRIEGAPVAMVQPARLATVLGHLIQNGIEASAPDAAVTVTAAASAGGSVAIEVIDQGHGMSAAFVREQLFRPFASTKPGGFGIGAHEARQLVEEMGGALHVASREGEGSTFRLLLPAAPAMEAAA